MLQLLDMKRFFLITLLLIPAAFAGDEYIVIDPSHGGPTEWGTTSAGFDEKTMGLELSKKIQKELEATDDFEIVLTRIGDYPVSMNDRRKIGNQYESAVYVSLHTATYSTEPKVISYVLKQPQAYRDSYLIPVELAHGKQYKHSMKMAQIMEDEMPENIEHEIIMSKYPLVSLIGVQTPAILIECQCFSADQKTDETKLDEIARAIARGLHEAARKVL